jgi:glyoxylase-like metal-dependent hydrolase (beta-lactamase superfamily II)
VTGPAGAALPVADAWFTATRVDDAITVLTEPHVDPLLRANFWHVRGRDRDLVVDCGLGVTPLRGAHPELFARDPVLVLSHGHLDHMGSAHEFDEVWAHPAEAVADPRPGSLDGAELAVELGLDAGGYGPLPELLITAAPRPGYDPRAYRLRPARVTRALGDGDTVDLGDRVFTALHLPGHSPGGLALFEERTGILFSGDVVYDGPLLDGLHGSDVAAYRHTMRRLRELPVRTVHAGHDSSFDGARLHDIIDTYLLTRSREATP